jgi:hypothetical protein
MPHDPDPDGVIDEWDLPGEGYRAVTLAECRWCREDVMVVYSPNNVRLIVDREGSPHGLQCRGKR